MKNKMRIAMFGHKRIPSREGGVEIVVEELSSRMVEKGHYVCCYNRKGHHVSGAEFDQQIKKTYNGIKIKNVFTIKKKGLAAVTSSFFAAILAALGKYDIVHIHAEGPCVMLWLPKLFGKKCIATIHGLDHQRLKWGGFASWYIKLGEKCAVKFADEIIVLSKGVQQYFQDTYGRKTSFIPNGVNKPDVYEPEIIKDKFDLDKNSYILFLGRLVCEKGIHYLIQAFKNIETDKKLVIAGGSSDTEDYVKKLKSLAEFDNRIIFTGFVQGKELNELYSNAYLYVLPSDLEGMPLSLLEAMSYGNCCLVSNISECTEVVEDKAITFKKGNVVDLQDKLQFLCYHPLVVESYKSNAASFVWEKYKWDDIVDKVLALYEN